jgi:integrase/recombinase XerD
MALAQLGREPANLNASPRLGTVFLARANAPLNPAHLYLDTLALGESRRVTKAKLDVLAKLLSCDEHTHNTYPWHGLTYDMVLRVRTHYMEKRSAIATTNTYVNCLRMVAKFCFRIGTMSEQTYKLIAEVPFVKGKPADAGRFIAFDEIALLLSEIKRKKRQYEQHRMMVLMLYGCGMRVAELINLTVDDVWKDDAGMWLRVLGKGNKFRNIPIPQTLQGVVWEYRAKRVIKNAIDESAICWLFPGPNPRQNVRTQSVRQFFARLTKKLGLERVTPHDMRRTYISALLSADADLATVSKLVGHSDVNMTARYDRRGEAVKRSTVEKLPLDAKWSI